MSISRHEPPNLSDRLDDLATRRVDVRQRVLDFLFRYSDDSMGAHMIGKMIDIAPRPLSWWFRLQANVDEALKAAAQKRKDARK